MTGPDTIFWPMGALALVTFGVLGLIPLRRLGASRRGDVTADDFRYGESSRVPPDVAIPNRAMMNLLEVPVLFYVVCLMAHGAALVTPPFLVLAWIYVGLRTVHSLIHCSYNNVLHRLVAFALSNFVLMAMWITFFVEFWRR